MRSIKTIHHDGASQVMPVVKQQPASAGDPRDVGREDPLEQEVATHPSILA